MYRETVSTRKMDAKVSKRMGVLKTGIRAEKSKTGREFQSEQGLT